MFLAITLYSEGGIKIFANKIPKFDFLLTSNFSKKWNYNLLYAGAYIEKSDVLNYGFYGYFSKEVGNNEVRIGAQPLPFSRVNSFFNPLMFPLHRRTVYYGVLFPYPWIDWGIVFYHKSRTPFYAGIVDGIGREVLPLGSGDMGILRIDDNNAVFIGGGIVHKIHELSGVLYWENNGISSFVVGYINSKVVINPFHIEVEYSGVLPQCKGTLFDIIQVAYTNFPIIRENVRKKYVANWGYGVYVEMSVAIQHFVRMGVSYGKTDSSDYTDIQCVSFIFSVMQNKGLLINKVRLFIKKENRRVYNGFGFRIVSGF